MACDVHAHVRMERGRGVMDVCSVMCVWIVQYTTQHVRATRAWSVNSGLRNGIAQKDALEASARVRHLERMNCVPPIKARMRST